MASKVTSFLKDFIITLIIAVCIAFPLKFFVIDSCKILSGSMEPTLVKDDRVLVSKVSYLFGEPQRGDIIIFDPPPEVDQGVGFIKRVIGLPGETLEVKDHAVYIDGDPLDESYLMEKPNYNFGPVTIPEDHYVVLGDNRNYSADAHIWSYPFISKEDITAKAVFQYFPLKDMGTLKK